MSAGGGGEQPSTEELLQLLKQSDKDNLVDRCKAKAALYAALSLHPNSPLLLACLPPSNVTKHNNLTALLLAYSLRNMSCAFKRETSKNQQSACYKCKFISFNSPPPSPWVHCIYPSPQFTLL